MRLERLRIFAFGSFDEDMQTIDLRSRGLVQIEGFNRDDPSAANNGSGKTMLVAAIRWCLYGTTPQGLEGDEVINRKFKACFVGVDGKVGKQKFSITRERGPFKLRFYIDGADETQGTSTATQEKITKFLGMTEATFVNSVMFGQTPGYRFSTLTDKEQKAVLDDALGIDQYARALDVARERMREIQKDQTSAEYEQSLIVTKIREAARDLRSYKDEHADFDAKRAAKLKALRKQKKKLRQLMTPLIGPGPPVLSKQIDVELGVLMAERDELKRKETDTLLDLAGVGAEIKACQQALDNTHAKKRCHTCNRKFSKDFRLKSIDALSRRITQHKQERRIYKQTASAIDEKLVEVGKAIDKWNIKRDAALKAEANYQTQRSQKLRLTAEYRRCKKEIAALETEKSPYEKLITSKQIEIVKARHERDRLRAIIADYEEQEKETKFWVDALGPAGLRAYLIDTALPFLNERVAHYSRILTDGSIAIEFATQSTLKSGKTAEKFTVSVLNRYGAATYKGNSAGERAKVDLAVGLALQDLVMSRSNTKTNCAFFDEVFEGMDPEGIDRAMQVLTDVAKRRESVFVITHQSALKSYFPDTITVEKKGGVSRVR